MDIEIRGCFEAFFPRISLIALTIAFAWVYAPFCLAETIASKNNKGNRLYEKGKNEEAEKAYLSAQGDDPGRAEILYNLGNSLIKQKKYRQGEQALGQAIRKGDKEIQQKGWYNAGDALFSMGNYKESAEAYIESLKLDPSDKDAKHNLELALLKLKQQQQQKSDKNQQQNSKDSDKDKSQESKNRNAAGQQQQNQNAGKEPEPQERPQKSAESARRNESITRDQALQLLDAVQNQEKEEQRKLLERRAMSRSNGKDW
jgi:tetratricopeptide (TPR) repeat protein